MGTRITALVLAVPTAVAGIALTATPAVAGPNAVARTFTGVDYNRPTAVLKATAALRTWQQNHREVCVERSRETYQIALTGQWVSAAYAECSPRGA